MNERRDRTWRVGGLWIAAALVGLVVLFAGLNMTRAPLQLARAFVAAVEEETGWEIALRGARFSGMTKLRLTDVAIRADGEDIQGELPVVDISFNPLHLIFRRGAEPAVGSVHLIRPRVSIGNLVADASEQAVRTGSRSAGEGEVRGSVASPAINLEIRVSDALVEEVTPQGEAARLWRVDGTLEAGGEEGTLSLRRARLKQVGGGIEATLEHEGGGDAGRYRLEAKGPAEFFLSLLGFDKWSVTGAMQASGSFTLGDGTPSLDAVRSGQLSVVVTGGELGWGGLSAMERAAFDTLKLELHGDGDTWRVEALTLQKGAAQVRAEGEVMRTASGSGAGATELELAVTAKGLTFPDDLPALESFGLGGNGEFAGVLSGPLLDPSLSGKLTIQDGRVWHRPVTRGEGVILLTRDLFRFQEAVLEKGSSTYALEGEIEWATSPGRLELVLDADRGDLDELLKAFSIDTDASGKIDGSIVISGPLGGVQISGEVRVSDALIRDEKYFDEARGRFGWNDGLLTLSAVEVHSGGGVAAVGGSLGRDFVALDVALTRWPLAAGEGVLASLPEGVGGWASYRGRLSGSVEAPRLTGELLGGELELGQLRLSDPRGAMVLTPDTLEVADLSLVSAGQGRYRLEGEIAGWREASPTVDLDVSVEGASLSGLLQESGLALPAWLLDGRVDGSLRMSGEAFQPDATFDLALTDDLGVAAPIRLQFGLQEGRLRLSRSTILSALMNAS